MAGGDQCTNASQYTQVKRSVFARVLSNPSFTNHFKLLVDY